MGRTPVKLKVKKLPIASVIGSIRGPKGPKMHIFLNNSHYIGLLHPTFLLFLAWVILWDIILPSGRWGMRGAGCEYIWSKSLRKSIFFIVTFIVNM